MSSNMDTLVPDIENKLFHNTISYLHNISNLGELNIPILRSIYSTKRRLIEMRQNIYLPSNLNKSTVKCQRCQLNLSDGPAAYHIKSSKKKSKFAERLLTKEQTLKPLTAYQRKYLKRNKNWSGNRLEIICKFCKKQSLIKLDKPKKVKILPNKSNWQAKKKKKKDKFCGLNQEIVLSSTKPRKIKYHVVNEDTSEIDKSKNKKYQFKITEKNDNLNKNDGSVSKGKETTKENLISNKKQMKKKSSLDKLTNFLKNNEVSKAKPVSNLKSFLQGL